MLASQRASTTFCWLPPDRLPTSCSIDGVRMRSRSMYRRASARLGLAPDEDPARQPCQDGERDVVAHRALQDQGFGLAFLGGEADAGRGSRRPGLRKRSRRTVHESVPAVTGRSPTMVFISSLRPAPTRPAMPTTSPARTVRSMSVTSSLLTPSSSRRPRPGARVAVEELGEVAADHHADELAWSVSRGQLGADKPPSRSTVIRSASWKISSIRCET